MRRLLPEEAAAWRAVAGTVRPLNLPRLRGGGPAKPVEGAISPAAASPVQHPLRQRSALPPPRERGGSTPANTLDASWDKNLATGRAVPDWTIDLHGHTLASAHARLEHSLGIAIKQGARLVLLITGRPARDNARLPPTSRGVIRASIADWLAASPHAGKIAAVRNAHPKHGGAGALYLVLRRARPK